MMLAMGSIVMWFMFTLFSSVSYAQVADKIRSAHCMSFTATTTLPGQPAPVAIKMLFLDPGHLRHETPGGMVTISDQQTGQTLVLNPATHTAQLVTVGQHDNVPSGDIAAEFRKLADQKGEPIGDKQIGQVKAKGFRVTSGGFPADVWADPKTGMPLRVEMRVSMGDAAMHMVMSDFEFDRKLDESLFSLEPPQGYALSTMKLEVNLNIEENVVTLLKAYSAAYDGSFPAQLNDPSLIANLFKAKGAGEPTADLMKVASSFGALTGTMFMAKKGVDYEYLPTAAKLGDADKIVFWHKDKESGKYRAVYGDLTIKEVAADKLPRKTEAPK